MGVEGDDRRSPFAAFLAIGFATSVLLFAMWQVLEITWVDFLHVNPNRSRANAWTMIALAPVDGFFLTLAM